MPWWHYVRQEWKHELRGEVAIRAAGVLLPQMNLSGGSKADVSRAVDLLEREEGNSARVFLHAANTGGRAFESRLGHGKSQPIGKLSTSIRLALEMAAHEHSERRALEGELHELETAWKDAEEIAGIADDMFLPESVTTELARLKRERDEG